MRSRHDFAVVGLPARHWKWRMEASAWSLAGHAARALERAPDVIVASDYLDLPRFRGMAPAAWRTVPCLVYFHENQLTYPAAPGATPGERDQSYGFTNLLTCVAADLVAFNSHYHLSSFADAARALLARLPSPRPRLELDQALERAVVVPPGVELDAIPLGQGPGAGAPLCVAYNHRWEHDKDPLGFLDAVLAATDGGARIELVLLGQTYDGMPAGVAERLSRLAKVTRHRGFTPDFAEYARQLGTCDLVVSTARHEFFGIAVAEAMAAGCSPLVPRRLAYPEVVGDLGQALYADSGELACRLAVLAADPAPLRAPTVRSRAREAVARHDAQCTARELDRICRELALE